MPINNNNEYNEREVDSRLSKVWSDNALIDKEKFRSKYHTIEKLKEFLADDSRDGQPKEMSRSLIQNIDWLFHLINSDESIDDIENALKLSLPESEANNLELSVRLMEYLLKSPENFNQYAVTLKQAPGLINKVIEQLIDDSECYCRIFCNAGLLAKAIIIFQDQRKLLVEKLIENDGALINSICQTSVGIGNLIDVLCFYNYSETAELFVTILVQYDSLNRLIHNTPEKNEELNNRSHIFVNFQNILPIGFVRDIALSYQYDLCDTNQSKKLLLTLLSDTSSNKSKDKSQLHKLLKIIFSALSEHDDL